MLTDIQTLPEVALPPRALEVLSMSQLLDNSKVLQTQSSQPTVLPRYSESDYHWLLEVLDALIEFMRRAKNHSVPELTENDYDWSHTLLVELVGAVGESETHPLRPLMEFVCRLIDNYEDKYVPQLTEQFPELAEEAPIETAGKVKQPISNTPQQSESELAAHAFFSIGFLLYHGNRMEKAISAYDTAIASKPDFVEAYNNRGIAQSLLGQHDKAIADYTEAIRLNPDYAMAYHNRALAKTRHEDFDSAIVDYTEAIRLNSNYAEAYAHRGIAKAELGNIDEARLDLQTALVLSEQQRNANFKTLIEKWLQRLDSVVLKQDNKKPHGGGQ